MSVLGKNRTNVLIQALESLANKSDMLQSYNTSNFSSGSGSSSSSGSTSSSSSSGSSISSSGNGSSSYSGSTSSSSSSSSSSSGISGDTASMSSRYDKYTTLITKFMEKSYEQKQMEGSLKSHKKKIVSATSESYYGKQTYIDPDMHHRQLLRDYMSEFIIGDLKEDLSKKANDLFKRIQNDKKLSYKQRAALMHRVTLLSWFEDTEKSIQAVTDMINKYIQEG